VGARVVRERASGIGDGAGQTGGGRGAGGRGRGGGRGLLVPLRGRLRGAGGEEKRGEGREQAGHGAHPSRSAEAVMLTRQASSSPLRTKGDSMRSSRVLARVCLAAALLAPASARAQQVALDRFEPAPAGDRMFGVESPYALGSGAAHVALLFDYAHNPYTLRHGPGSSDVQAVVSDQMFLHLDVSVAILDRLNLNFSVPAAVLQDGADPTVGSTTILSPHDAAFGDMRVGARVRAFGAWDAPFQLGVSGYLWIPSGAGGLYVSDGKAR